MSARFVIAKVLGSLATLLFVIAFNFFLFRVVEPDLEDVFVEYAKPHH